MAVVEAQASGLACVASDVVPEETNASGRVTYLPLRAPDTVWAEAVLECSGRDFDSKRAVQKKFDIVFSANALCMWYSKG